MGNGNGNGASTIPIMGGVVMLGITLILGAYGYTYNEAKAEQEEKRVWRQEHQRVLDKKFDEIKEGQDKLTDRVSQGNDTTKDLLNQILLEQRKVEANLKKEKHSSSSGN